MTQKKERAALPTQPNPDHDFAARKINPDCSLEHLRKQYLAEVFALPADTAVTIAELAFGGER